MKNIKRHLAIKNKIFALDNWTIFEKRIASINSETVNSEKIVKKIVLFRMFLKPFLMYDVL